VSRGLDFAILALTIAAFLWAARVVGGMLGDRDR
jgi:hypothetical protein